MKNNKLMAYTHTHTIMQFHKLANKSWLKTVKNLRGEKVNMDVGFRHNKYQYSNISSESKQLTSTMTSKPNAK